MCVTDYLNILHTIEKKQLNYEHDVFLFKKIQRKK